MDAAEAHRIKVFLSLKDFYNTSSDWPPGVDFDALATAVVMEFRGHPALLGWYLTDEAPVSMMPMVAARRALVASLDPQHITYFMEIEYTSALAEPMQAFTNAMFGVDTYPWFNSSLSPDIGGEGRQQYGLRAAFQGKHLQHTALCSAMQTFDMKAFFCPRCQPQRNQTSDCLRCGCTFPPQAVLRAMAFLLPIASGSRGILQYSYPALFGGPGHPRQPRGAPAIAERLAALQALGRELRAHAESALGSWDWRPLRTNSTTACALSRRSASRRLPW